MYAGYHFIYYNFKQYLDDQELAYKHADKADHIL